MVSIRVEGGLHNIDINFVCISRFLTTTELHKIVLRLTIKYWTTKFTALLISCRFSLHKVSAGRRYFVILIYILTLSLYLPLISCQTKLIQYLQICWIMFYLYISLWFKTWILQVEQWNKLHIYLPLNIRG